jgi:23S rRNA (pseudouridine1915-N3)-methyltransferase
MGTKRSHRGGGRPAPAASGFEIRIVAGGRWRAGDAARSLYEDYVRRLPWPTELAEIEVRTGDPARRLSTEGCRMLEVADAKPGRVLIALDERGHDLGSEAFAARIRGWLDEGRPGLCFAIGGADGLASPVRSGADLVLSFGTMTWPHLMVRAMLAEQLYRASAILSGHPYHRA